MPTFPAQDQSSKHQSTIFTHSSSWSTKPRLQARCHPIIIMSYVTTKGPRTQEMTTDSLRKYLAALTAVAAVQQAVALPQPQTFPITQCNTDTYLVGDGDPHQNYWHVQVTSPLDCGDGGDGCNVSKLTQQTIGFTVSAGVSAGPWVSAGFSVEQSVSTGEQHTCEQPQSSILRARTSHA
jgi:hypothetical protein